MSTEEQDWWAQLVSTSNPAIAPNRILIPRFDAAQDRYQTLPEESAEGLLPHEPPKLVWVLPCPLLDLPRELREIIWIYALTATHGLLACNVEALDMSDYFREPRDRIGNLDFVTDNNLLPHEANLGYMIDFVDKGNAEDSMRRPSSPTFNQLRYVVKQILEDTRGLLFKSNELRFLANEGQGIRGVEMASRFVADYAPEVKATLRSIIATHGNSTIEDDADECNSGDVFQAIKYDYPLSDFCRQYPSAKVILRFPIANWNISKLSSCINQVLTWQWALRGHTTIRISDIRKRDFEANPYGQLKTFRSFKLVKPLPHNLRITLMEHFETVRPKKATDQFEGGNLYEIMEDAEKLFRQGMGKIGGTGKAVDHL